MKALVCYKIFLPFIETFNEWESAHLKISRDNNPFHNTNREAAFLESIINAPD